MQITLLFKSLGWYFFMFLKSLMLTKDAFVITVKTILDKHYN